MLKFKEPNWVSIKPGYQIECICCYHIKEDLSLYEPERRRLLQLVGHKLYHCYTFYVKHKQNYSTSPNFILITASYWHLHTHFKLLTSAKYLIHKKTILINLRIKIKKVTFARYVYIGILHFVGQARAHLALVFDCDVLLTNLNVYNLESRSLGFLSYYTEKENKLYKICISELFDIIGNP